MPKKLLIVSFVFPPASGIGGRRWAKFSKYLYRQGYDFKIISNRIWKTEQSNWDADVVEFVDRVIRIKSGYPKYLNMFTAGPFEKVMYRISLLYLKLCTRGSYYDRSVFWKRRLLKEVEKHLQQGYNTVLVSCAPYRSAYYLCTLKKQYPEMNLIVDLRDPWDMNSTLYGFSNLSATRKAYEMKIQDEVMVKADQVISVYQEVTSQYKAQYPAMADKFHTIDNGFDKDDFAEIPVATEVQATEKIEFLFAGSFYPGARHILEDFIKSLNKLKKSNLQLYNQLSFKFYGGVPDFFDQVISPHKAIVKHGGMIPLQSVYQKIAESDFMMLFLLDEMNYSLSTKFYEYISQNKPIVVFARGGSAGEFVRDNELGYFADFGKMSETLVQLAKDYNQGKRFNPKTQIDTSQFDVEHLTKQVIEVIEQ